MSDEAILVSRAVLEDGSVQLTFSVAPGQRRNVVLAPGQESPAAVQFLARAVMARYGAGA